MKSTTTGGGARTGGLKAARSNIRWHARSALTKTVSRGGFKLMRPATHELVITQLHDGMVQWYFPGLQARGRRIALMCNLMGTPPAEAMYVVNSLNESLAVDGEICEFGVAQGTTSALIANEIADTSRHLWLYDSFEGLPRPTEKDVLIDDIFGLGSMEKYEGKMACGAGEVRRRLADIGFPSSRVKIVPGFITPDTTVDILPVKVAFAYIDFDLYEPIYVTLKLLRSRIAVGGHIVVDDYGYFSEGAQVAVDEFLTEHKEEFEILVPPAFAGGFCVLKRVDACPENGEPNA